MNGAHDLGGMHGFGPVEPEPNEPVFHHEWERRAFAITIAAGFLGRWNLDMSRYAREQMPPAEYLATGYYEHWLYGLERLLVEKGLLTREAIEARVQELWQAARSGSGGEKGETAAGARVLGRPAERTSGSDRGAPS
jgi:nitrile hydratase beta subunit